MQQFNTNMKFIKSFVADFNTACSCWWVLKHRDDKFFAEFNFYKLYNKKLPVFIILINCKQHW